MNKLAFILAVILFGSSANADVISDLKKKMRYLNQNQAVISQNVANADTPKYKAKKLEPLKFGKSNSKQLSLATTSPGHISKSGRKNSFKKVRDNTYETAPNGNNVVLEEQMIKMSENDVEYQKTLGTMRQMTGLIRAAIGDQK